MIQTINEHGSIKEWSGKVVLEFWTGGANSTYLLLQNLLCGHAVVATYVDMLHNFDKTKRELAAQELLKQDIKKFCDYFNRSIPTYADANKIFALTDFYYHTVSSQQLIISMFSLMVGDDFDEVQLGNSNEHYATEFQKELIDLHNGYYKHRSNIIFPLENVRKEEIYLTLQSYDKLLGTKFIKHISVCDNVDEQCDEVLECESCINQHMLFHRLKWI